MRRGLTGILASMLIGLGALALLQAKEPEGFTVPNVYYRLPNGLRVVLSHDSTAPTVVIAVYYRIGFRVEPKDRTGFAHLFEHMMFQGSRNLGKMEFVRLVQENGGILNGSTRFDFTNYFELLPSNKLETALWAEADRMKGLAITEENLKNQQGVVGNEVKVNVLNQPYGGFPWLWMPQYANTNWHNAHNFYGDLKDGASGKIVNEVRRQKAEGRRQIGDCRLQIGELRSGELRQRIVKWSRAFANREIRQGCRKEPLMISAPACAETPVRPCGT